MLKHKYTFPFLIYIDKAEKHKERFAVRSKLMTLDARYNKYIENFESIRIIQNYLTKKCDRFLIPKIDNNNIDKSLGMIQETILRALRDIHSNKLSMYNEESDNLPNYFNCFSKFKKNVLSSKEANILISQKVNKNFLLEKFFGSDKTNVNCTKNDSYCNGELNTNKKYYNVNANVVNVKKECLSDDEIVKNVKDVKTKQQDDNTRKKNSRHFRYKGYSTQKPTSRKKLDIDDKVKKYINFIGKRYKFFK